METMRVKLMDGSIISGSREELSSSLPQIADSEQCLDKAIGEDWLLSYIDQAKNISVDVKTRELVDAVCQKISCKDENKENIYQLLKAVSSNRNHPRKHKRLVEEMLKDYISYVDQRLCVEKGNGKKLEKIRQETVDLLNTVHDDIEGDVASRFIGKLGSSYINSAIPSIRAVTKSLSTTPAGMAVIDKGMDLLSRAKDATDLDTVVRTVLNHRSINNSSSRGIDSWYKTRKMYQLVPNFTKSILTKGIVSSYIDSKIDSWTTEELADVEMQLVKGADLGTLLELKTGQFSESSKENGIFDLSKRVFNDKVHEAYDRSSHVICWDCSNGFPSKCQKVADYVKQSIDAYDFIRSGYQVIENGEVKKFVVSSCDCFGRNASSVPMSNSELKKLTDSLAMYFYDADSPEEVRRIRDGRGSSTRGFNGFHSVNTSPETGKKLFVKQNGRKVNRMTW